MYLWTKKPKSRGVDLYIDEDNFYTFQARLLMRSIRIKRNPRLEKFGTKIDDVEVDIYTPFLCNLPVPPRDFFEKHWFSRVEGFRVAIPEVLLLLKGQASRERWSSEKGMKDRSDLISLLAFGDIKFDLLKKTLGRVRRERRDTRNDRTGPEGKSSRVRVPRSNPPARRNKNEETSRKRTQKPN